MPELLERLQEALPERYRVERELGAGGTCVVYLAEGLKHHRSVALKILRPEPTACLGHERFLREIEVASRLTHPLTSRGRADRGARALRCKATRHAVT